MICFLETGANMKYNEIEWSPAMAESFLQQKYEAWCFSKYNYSAEAK